MFLGRPGPGHGPVSDRFIETERPDGTRVSVGRWERVKQDTASSHVRDRERWALVIEVPTDKVKPC